ncbi:tellurium resistance protein TerC [Aliiglaciecola sp.]|nr:tellurium resistance protein TerC [Aliiglaciecola sp.]
MKILRIGLGVILSLIGIVFAILPGSILFLIGGLMVLSYDVPIAKTWLKKCQAGMSAGAKKLDRHLLNRRLKRF